MKDGYYDLCFSANGYVGTGQLTLDGHKAKGSDGAYRLEGNLFDGSQHISAVFNVLMEPRILRNRRIPAHYTLQMEGTARGSDFELIGIGPIGLIVAISCAYRSPLTPEEPSF